MAPCYTGWGSFQIEQKLLLKRNTGIHRLRQAQDQNDNYSSLYSKDK